MELTATFAANSTLAERLQVVKDLIHQGKPRKHLATYLTREGYPDLDIDTEPAGAPDLMFAEGVKMVFS